MTGAFDLGSSERLARGALAGSGRLAICSWDEVVRSLTIVDARTLEDGARLEAAVCIVGAGAAGLTLAFELEAAGREVLLVESGGFAPDETVQSLYDLDSVGYPPRPNYMARARQFGGSCNVWAGRCMPLQELDLAGRPWVPDSAWPIGADEVRRHYPKAAAILGLPAIANFDLATHDGRVTADERSLLAARDVSPIISLWAPRPKRFGRSERRRLARSSRVRLLIHASVTHIDLDDDGDKVRALTAQTLTGRTLKLAARTFVLAAGGLETPRLLLVSRDRQSQGIGNGHDLVGRYFMEHPRSVFGAVRTAPGCRLMLMRGWPLADGKVQLGLGASPQAQAREGLLNHYLTFEEAMSGYAEQHYQAAIEVGKVLLRRGHTGGRLELGAARRAPALQNFAYLLSPKEILPHRLWRLVTLARNRFARNDKPRRYIVVYFCEQPPEPASRLTLAHDTDRLGVNRLVLDWRIPESVPRSLLRLQGMLGGALEQSGLGILEPGAGEPAYTDASHHMGTTRMGDSPRTGVVDRDCRVFGVRNLYIASSSGFPSAGHANPTLTIVAMALRLADHLRSLPRA
jgi:choline dehydrogenase-like flavoprotein